MSDFLRDLVQRRRLSNVAGEYSLVKIGLKGTSKASIINLVKDWLIYLSTYIKIT